MRPEGISGLWRKQGPSATLPLALLSRSWRAMLGLDFIKANRAAVEAAIRDKAVDARSRRRCWRSMARCARLKTEIEALRAERNAISAQVQGRRAAEKAELGADRQGGRSVAAGDARRRAWRQGGRAQGAAAAPAEYSLRAARRSGPTRASTSSSAPRANCREFDFEPLDHVALIEKNDWADLKRITEVSGADLLPQGAAGVARDQADGLGAGADRRSGLHADHRARDRARAGVPQPGPVSRARGRDLSSCPTTICGSRGRRRSR